MKSLMTAAALMILPGLALAMGCSGSKHDDMAMSCAQGTTWDAATNTCVEVVTG